MHTKLLRVVGCVVFAAACGAAEETNQSLPPGPDTPQTSLIVLNKNQLPGTQLAMGAKKAKFVVATLKGSATEDFDIPAARAEVDIQNPSVSRMAPQVIKNCFVEALGVEYGPAVNLTLDQQGQYQLDWKELRNISGTMLFVPRDTEVPVYAVCDVEKYSVIAMSGLHQAASNLNVAVRFSGFEFVRHGATGRSLSTQKVPGNIFEILRTTLTVAAENNPPEGFSTQVSGAAVRASAFVVTSPASDDAAPSVMKMPFNFALLGTYTNPQNVTSVPYRVLSPTASGTLEPVATGAVNFTCASSVPLLSTVTDCRGSFTPAVTRAGAKPAAVPLESSGPGTEKKALFIIEYDTRALTPALTSPQEKLATELLGVEWSDGTREGLKFDSSSAPIMGHAVTQ